MENGSPLSCFELAAAIVCTAATTLLGEVVECV